MAFDRLAKASPNNPQIELNLAFLLARGEEPRWETRVEGIERLARLALIPSVSANATENWKLALGWLGVTKPEMLGLFDAYLKLHPDDSDQQLRVRLATYLYGEGAGLRLAAALAKRAR